MNLDDTIVAIATPAGRGGIGVVRISGPEARAIVAPMLRLARELEPGRAVFGELVECAEAAELRSTEQAGAPFDKLRAGPAPTQEKIDEVVITYFAKPHSYTSDDVIEISAHGSPVVLQHVVEMALARGARLAEPGEFTLRAFLNGRIDLTQAEAVRDLIESQTLYQARVAAQQLGGALSHRLQPIKEKLVALIARLEAGVDFAEDDVSVLPGPQIVEGIAAVEQPLRELLRSFDYGRVVHEGLSLAIVGRPNVGKSSLFNRLVERERAIVTATPGTTRDLVSETVALGGIPVRLMDTAGIRASADEAESIGIRKSREALADADVVLVVLDASQPSQAEDRELLDQVRERRAIVVHNKIDLSPPVSSRAREAAQRSGAAERVEACPEPGRRGPCVSAAPVHVYTSATTGDGIPELRAAILRHIHGDEGAQAETGFLTNLRQQKLVEDSLAALSAARGAVEGQVPHEMLLIDLYNALRPLDEITGATTADDILNRIFSTFCIGK